MRTARWNLRRPDVTREAERNWSLRNEDCAVELERALCYAGG